VFAGNLGESQAFDVILDAAETLVSSPEIQWLVLGDGRRLEWVESEVQRRGLSSNVRLLGRRPAVEMPAYFAQADALLVSLADKPIYGMTVPSKVQSYLASGRPIIASLNGEGARVIEESGAGLVAAAGDAQGLAQVVRRLASMSATDREEMGSNGSRYYQSHFERGALLSHAEALLSQLVARAQR
jgi:glycosyltransferase involved in cell wall biosynthesis